MNTLHLRPFLLTLLAGSLAGAQAPATGIQERTPYRSPAPYVHVSRSHVFTVDVTQGGQVPVALWGSQAAVVAWPMGASAPENGLRLLNSKGQLASPDGAWLQTGHSVLPTLAGMPTGHSYLRTVPSGRGLYHLDFSQARSGAKAFTVAVKDGSGVELHTAMTQSLYRPGETPVITAWFQEQGAPQVLPLARLTVRIPSPQGPVSLPMTDTAGDGVYRAALPPASIALTTLRVEAQATVDGLPLVRTGQTSLAMASGSGRILALGNPVGLSLPVQVEVDHPGPYRLQGTLVGQDGQGRLIQVGLLEASETVACAGVHTFHLGVDAKELAAAGLDSSYQLRAAALVDLEEMRVADEVSSLGAFSLGK